MKLLFKLLGVSDYIENLERFQKEDTDFITTLLTDKTELISKLKHTEQELDNAFTELNELLSTKTILTAQIIKLREQLEEEKNKVCKLQKLNDTQSKTITNLQTKLTDIRYTIKHRLINFIKYDLEISINLEDIKEDYDN